MIVYQNNYEIIVNSQKRVVVINNLERDRLGDPDGDSVDLTEVIESPPYSSFQPYQEVLYDIWCYALARKLSNRNI